MAATTKSTGQSPRHTSDVVAQWRIRCMHLEDKLADLQAAHSALQEQYSELRLDYRHALDKVWRQNSGLSTRREQR